MKKRYIISGILLTIFLVYVSGSYIGRHYYFFDVVGQSMSPTLNSGDIVLLKKKESLHKNDIIVFEPPVQWLEETEKTYDSLFVKRIIATQGDTIVRNTAGLFVNDIFIDSLSSCSSDCSFSYTLGRDEFFVAGDNSGHSFDSLKAVEKNIDFIIKKQDIIAGGTIEKKLSIPLFNKGG